MLSWKYVNAAEINKDFDFVNWVIKTTCLFYFSSVKFRYVKETHMISVSSSLALVKIVVVSQHKKDNEANLCQDLLTIWKHRLGLESACAALCKWQLIRVRLAAFQKLLQTRQTSRNNKGIIKTRTLTNELDTGVKSFLTQPSFLYRTNTKVYAYS